MKKKLLKILLILLILSGFFLIGLVYFQNKSLLNQDDLIEKEIVPDEIAKQEVPVVVEEERNTENGDEVLEKDGIVEQEVIVDSKDQIPAQIIRNVSFVPQAPFAVWDELHEEACEEASLIMVKYHLDGKKLTKQEMEDEIQMLVDYQKEKYGDYKDSDMKELKEIAEDYYDIKNIKIVRDFSKEDIKKYLAEGNLIIAPTAGRELGNPNFTPPGPLYHNLVLIGYDGDNIITNDPGTRNGKDYIYDENVLYDAIHDFPGSKKKILNGDKVMLVFPLD